MSFTGLKQFKENLDTLFESKTFKDADECQRFELGYRFLNSDYGKGNFFGKIKKLKDIK